MKGDLRVPQREGLQKFREKRRQSMRFGGQYRPKYRRGLAHVELRRTPRALGMPQMKTRNCSQLGVLDYRWKGDLFRTFLQNACVMLRLSEERFG